MSRRISVLFLCTGNSARSIMAEAIANQLHGDVLDARSAGSAPKDEPHPIALETLATRGLDTAGLRSESWERYGDDRFDLVITLCDAAAAECPNLPGGPPTVHWGFPDPPADPRPREAFARVFDGLRDVIGRFARSREPDPVHRRLGRERTPRPPSDSLTTAAHVVAVPPRSLLAISHMMTPPIGKDAAVRRRSIAGLRSGCPFDPQLSLIRHAPTHDGTNDRAREA